MCVVIASIASLRKNIGFICLFSCLSVTFLLLAAGEFSGNARYASFDYLALVRLSRSVIRSVHKAGGGLGIVTAFIAYYIGLSDLLAAEKAAVIRPPIGVFRHD
jgi:succinate-acetate transporter protein